MSPNYQSLIAFLLVAGVHLAALTAVVLAKPEPAPVGQSQPSIQGVIVMAQPVPAPPPPEPVAPPPEPVLKPAPKPAPKPLPKAPASERAPKVQEPEPSPAPAEPTPVEPEPVALPAAPAPQAAPATSSAVVPPSADAGQISNPAPVYPSLSRRLREQGLVVLEILIRADGTVGQIKLKNSSGFKRLDQAAISAVKNWRFKPATQAGKAIDYWYEQPLEFNLH